MKKCNQCGGDIGKFKAKMCASCAGKKSRSNYKRVRKDKELKSNNRGYLYYSASMLTDEEYRLSGRRNIALAHRLVMAMHLNRVLKRSEIVRHLDGDKANNNLSNLSLGTQKQNIMQHVELKVENSALHAENERLKQLLGEKKSVF